MTFAPFTLANISMTFIATSANVMSCKLQIKLHDNISKVNMLHVIIMGVPSFSACANVLVQYDTTNTRIMAMHSL